MKKWAKIVDNISKICNVGEGTDAEYYKSIGMEWLDVEKSYNGVWYIKGYAPIEPQPSWEDLRIAELKAKLTETDYIYNVIREGDATEEYYAQTISNRKAWRAEIRELEKKDDQDNEGAV